MSHTFVQLSCVGLLWIAWAEVLHSEPSTREKQIQVPEGARIAFQYPARWTLKEEREETLPMVTLTLENPEDASTLLLTLFVAQAGSNSGDLKTLRTMLISGTRPLAQNSVEKRLRISSYQTTNVFGVYTTQTDARYRTTPPPKGNFKYCTSFAVNCTGHVAMITFLSNTTGSKALEPVFNLVGSLRKAR